MSSVREVLKKETLSAHLLVEDQMACLTKPTLSKNEYSAILIHMYNFFSSFELSLLGYRNLSAAADFYLKDRSRLNRIKNDLEYLQVTPPLTDHKKLLPSEYDISIEAKLWGMLYVIEGSSLGGQIIAKNLFITLGVTASGGASFYSGYGPETGKMWRNFLETLELSAAKDNLNEAIDGALSVFKLMSQTDTSFVSPPTAQSISEKSSHG